MDYTEHKNYLSWERDVEFELLARLEFYPDDFEDRPLIDWYVKGFSIEEAVEEILKTIP